MDTEIQFSVLQTSRGRSWSGFDATIYEATPGYDETLCASHSISMHLGAPALVTSSCDDSVVRRVQVPGDLKIIPAGFSRIWEIDRLAHKLTINVRRSLIETAAEAMGVREGVAIDAQLYFRDPHIEHIGWAFKHELESDQPLGRLYAESLGLALASHLVRRATPKHKLRIDEGLSKRRLRRVTDYIHEHLSDDLSLAELAATVTVSPSYFNVLFKQSVGMSVHQFVIRARVERATQLLLDERLPLSEVALRCGFASQSHMSTCIQRIVGVTPASLRRSAR